MAQYGGNNNGYGGGDYGSGNNSYNNSPSNYGSPQPPRNGLPTGGPQGRAPAGQSPSPRPMNQQQQSYGYQQSPPPQGQYGQSTPQQYGQSPYPRSPPPQGQYGQSTPQQYGQSPSNGQSRIPNNQSRTPRAPPQTYQPPQSYSPLQDASFQGRNSPRNPQFGSMGRDSEETLLEMQPMSNKGSPSPKKPPADPNFFFNELQRISRDIDAAEQLLNDLDRLKAEVFSSVDQNKVADGISMLSARAKKAFTSIIEDIKALKATPGASGAPKRQIEAKQDKLKKLKEAFSQKEMELNHAVRDQMRDQMKIAHPELDEYQIADAVPDAKPQQIFLQSIMQSGRRGQAATVLGAVKARSEEIEKLEKGIIEVAELFSEMESMVLQQGELIEKIDVQAEEAKEDIVEANVQLGKAEVKARSARKKKWWCLGICVLIIVVIVVVVLIYKFVIQGQSAGKRRRSLSLAWPTSGIQARSAVQARAAPELDARYVVPGKAAETLPGKMFGRAVAVAFNA